MIFSLLVLLPMPIASAGFAVQTQVVSSQVQPQGSHGVRNLQYGLFLRPREASSKDGEPIVLYPQQPWKCMAWRFEQADNGLRLVNYFTSKSFEVGADKHALIQMPASADQKASETIRFVDLKDGSYKIEAGKNEAAGATGVLTAVDSDGRGDIRVSVEPWMGTAAQKWQLVDIPDHFTM